MICSGCGERKLKSDFRKGSRRCKNCINAYFTIWRRNNREKRAAAQKRYFAKHPEMKKAALLRQRNVNKIWRKNNHEKSRAHKKVARAVRKGRLIKPDTCTFCSNKNPQGHHTNYNEPLVVIWVCSAHHKAIHRGELKVK